MLQLQIRLRVAVSATIAVLVAAPSTVRADTTPGTAQIEPLTQATIGKTINGIVVELREGYVFPDKGAHAADALEKSLKESAYAGVTDPVQFARQVTDQLRAITKDSHMRVIFGSPFANQPPPAVPQGAGFEVKRADGNIGLIRLVRFVSPDVFKPAADEAMHSLSDTEALIIDMQANGGGHPASVAYLVSYFLDPGKPVHINSLVWRNRGTDTYRTETFWSSQTPLRYLGKPVYVLVGPKTYSAGEEFAYDLQALKRATVVGAKTRGGANPGGLTDLGSNFFVVVPTGRAENPITHTNWEGVGVLPDVQAAPDVAESTALALAKG
ncbi:S41 family peptidase [Pseudorhodoplanes sinuspersici]|uniref:Peptidase S41 n=1 Tax=Pseudorhodoplanes sinuspersici TaxID=1235591 RepID=A0A1W6ZWR7_9HYPH|nr:S41 family peptidase [Pseudorhodoplanes sinuspersici]ARQ01814.1 peptidase S41 [Pseudorhodoplanes sinuspersici]RKE73568.1 peptidase S41-like protein [Pseudorhodoplanes sinuspersici]